MPNAIWDFASLVLKRSDSFIQYVFALTNAIVRWFLVLALSCPGPFSDVLLIMRYTL